MLAIDKHIPLIPVNAGRRVYPFAELAVGDSFLVPVPAEPADTFHARRKRRQQALAERARGAVAITKHRYATRQVDGGVRVWRIA